jgi:hypothetical protein
MEAAFPPARGKNLLPLDEVTARLMPVMEKGDYVNEDEFDKLLFKALLTCFNTYVVAEEEEKYFTLHVGADTDKYAVGIARRVDCTRGVVAEHADSTSSELTTTAPSREMYHGSCVFEKMGNGWTVTDIFAVVELKTSATSCKEFKVVNNMVAAVDLNSNHGALGQAILYGMGCVLMYHARNGVLRNDDTGTTTAETGQRKRRRRRQQKRLPLAILAGTLGTVGKTKRLRWVYGSLVIPLACGNQFKYMVHSFGKFCHDEEEEDQSIIDALSVYMDTILFGLVAAIRVYRDRVDQKPYQPDPISGRKLMVGDQTLNWPVYASPIPMPKSETLDPNGLLIVSQGELFCGELNVHELLAISNLKRAYFVELGENDERMPVLVKVSSRAVNSILIWPSETFFAIKVAKDVLRNPLLAVVEMGVGLVTIMADLSKQKYKILQPKDHERLLILWDGFKELAIDALLRLAEYDVIHADIRPGFDLTTNILVKLDRDKARMELVDYESLVFLNDWTVPQTHRGYIQKGDGWDATTFVWWQCITVAYAWIEELPTPLFRKQVDWTSAADVKSFQIALLHGTRPRWLPEPLHGLINQSRIGEEAVINTFDLLRPVFESIDRRSAQVPNA